MRWILMGIEIVFDTIFAYILYKAYRAGIEIGIAFLNVDFWFVRVTLGIIGCSFALFAFRWARGVLLYVLKCALIYNQCYPEEIGIISIFAGASSRFGSLLTIPVFNKCIRDMTHEIVDILQDSASAPAELQEILKNFDGTMISTLAKFSKKLALRMFDYVDECILAYCFLHKDVKMTECALDATAAFCKSAGKLMKQVFTLTITEAVLRFFFYLFAVLFLLKFGTLSVLNVIYYYVAVKGASYVFESAILENFFMTGVINVFCTETGVGKYARAKERTENEEIDDETGDDANILDGLVKHASEIEVLCSYLKSAKALRCLKL